MSFVTFIYRIKPSMNKYIGKYIFHDCLIDDHEGLDQEVKYNVIEVINRYRVYRGESKLSASDVVIGILSFTSNDGAIPVYSSYDEVNAFDFYYESSKLYSTDNSKAYINGTII